MMLSYEYYQNNVLPLLKQRSNSIVSEHNGVRIPNRYVRWFRNQIIRMVNTPITMTSSDFHHLVEDTRRQYVLQYDTPYQYYRALYDLGYRDPLECYIIKEL